MLLLLLGSDHHECIHIGFQSALHHEGDGLASFQLDIVAAIRATEDEVILTIGGAHIDIHLDIGLAGEGVSAAILSGEFCSCGAHAALDQQSNLLV